MKIAALTQRVILDATIDRSVIRGTLTAPSGQRRDFHGWLELNTALEAIVTAGGVSPPATNSVTPPAGDPVAGPLGLHRICRELG